MPHDLAGKPATPEMLIDVNALLAAYHDTQPDPTNAAQRVSFGTSGHRGTSLTGAFTQAHILAITQAICEYREQMNITGPLYIGMDSHALSAPAQQSALEVLAANGVQAIVQAGGGFTPTPVISHAILTYNRGKTMGLADGIVITPSHNPPADGGFKYNPPNGGPADTDVTSGIQDRANEILEAGGAAVKRVDVSQGHANMTEADLITPYVSELDAVINIDAIRSAGVKMGCDPLGGSAQPYWPVIADKWKLNITITNDKVDPQFGFMRVDHDGKIRMDCSSQFAMAGLLDLKDQFQVAFANDPDADRHGIVTPRGLMNPNHYLAVCIKYLYANRPGWGDSAAVGKTLVSSAMIDRVAKEIYRKLYEVPVGFKWFTPGLFDGSLGFGGEESAGASFLRMNAEPWSTDKDGLILCLLAAEITAVTGKDPSEHYRELTARHGAPQYTRIDRDATPEEKAKLKKLSPDDVKATQLAGELITQKLTEAPGNGAAIGGLKVCTENGWFAARPSGTEAKYKIYAESFKSEQHLAKLLDEAGEIVGNALG